MWYVEETQTFVHVIFFIIYPRKNFYAQEKIIEVIVTVITKS